MILMFKTQLSHTMSFVIEKPLSGEGKGSLVVAMTFEPCEREFCLLKVR